MTWQVSAFPFSTPYDTSTDPATSVDPLGLVAEAERLADLILPGMTARMWRPRLLTLSVVAAVVADRVVELEDGNEAIRGDARLAFERLYVSAVIRRVSDDPRATRRLPGSDRARRALRTGEPLTRTNFLKGQVINGPTGVMARLARQIKITDDEHGLERLGQDLLRAWSVDEGLHGVLEGADDGGKWIKQMTEKSRDCLKGKWPEGSSVWENLSGHLRPDQLGTRERKKIKELLWSDVEGGVRGRMLDLLRDSFDTYRAYHEDQQATVERGRVERAVLQDGLKPRLTDSPADQRIRSVLDAIDAFERCGCLLQSAFDALRWGLVEGEMQQRRLLDDGTVIKSLERAKKRIPNAVSSIDKATEQLEREGLGREVLEPLRNLRDDADAASRSTEALFDAVLVRHGRIQKEKNRGRWIVRDDTAGTLVLAPGFGLSADRPPWHENLYLHPFRILNAYAMLGELNVVRGVQVAEED